MSTSDQPECAWLCGPPQGPSTPFATPELAVLDALRVVAIAAAAAVLLSTVLLLIRHRTRTPGQRARFIASAGLALVAASVEYEHLGDLGNWRLIIGLMSLMALAWGNWSALLMESPTLPRWNRRGAAE